MKRISYYPGCALKSGSKGMETAAQAVLAELGYTLSEIPGWNCCGVVYPVIEDDLIHRLAPVRNLIRAHQQGDASLVTLCAMCYNTLWRANRMMRDEPEKRDKINRFMHEEPDYHGEIEVFHLLSFLDREVGWDSVASRVKRPLEGLRIAPYYGCMLTRPREAAIESGRDFSLLTHLLESLGADVAYFEAADRCCGSYQSVGNPQSSLEATAAIIEAAGQIEADALALACPLCEFNLKHHQKQLVDARRLASPVPVVYFTQLLAYSFELCSEENRFDIDPFAFKLLTSKMTAQPITVAPSSLEMDA